MGAEHTHLTPEQAREQLAASQSQSLRIASDRNVHAIRTAVLGLSVGLLTAPQNVLSGTSAIVADVIFVTVWMGGAIWVERAARTVPRRARLWSRLGIGTSILVALVAVLPWLNLSAQTEPNTWPMVLAGALVIAVPSLIAAVAIVGGRE